VYKFKLGCELQERFKEAKMRAGNFRNKQNHKRAGPDLRVVNSLKNVEIMRTKNKKTTLVQ
jgi:hypothetical protein